MNPRQFVTKIQNAMMTLAIGCLIGSTSRAQETTAPATPPTHGQHDNVKPAIHWKMFHYTCDGGKTVSVSLAGDLAKVLFENHQYLMKQTRSADGNRYSDGKVLWWGRGEGGFLQQDTPDGEGAMLAKDCKLAKPVSSEKEKTKEKIQSEGAKSRAPGIELLCDPTETRKSADSNTRSEGQVAFKALRLGHLNAPCSPQPLYFNNGEPSRESDTPDRIVGAGR